MFIVFGTKKIAKYCNERKQAEKAFGTKSARKLMQRLSELSAAHNPIPLLPDHGVDLKKVTEIEIIAIEDTHRS